MTEFEAILHDCLEALRDGRADIDACLSRYPQHAEALRPHLRAAMALMEVYADTEPRAEWVASARERFLIATGERISQAYDEAEPSPSFFAAARVKFLMTAQRMRGASGGGATDPHRPVFGRAFRGLAAAGLALVMMLGFSTYTVATAQNALPGDWRYPIKRQTEQVRLALAFSEGAERDVRLDIAAERAEEIERLSEQGRIVPPGVIRDLNKHTQVIASQIEKAKLDQGELQRVQEITERTAAALPNAKVAPEAEPVRAAVLEAASDLFIAAGVAAAQDPRRPVVLTPTRPFETPEATDTPAPSPTDTPAPTEDPGPPPATPTSPPPTPERGGLSVDATPVGVDIGLTWMRLAVGRLTTLIPSEKDGWRVAGVNVSQGSTPAPTLVRITNQDNTQTIAINPRNGDMWWYVSVNGIFDEVQVRAERDGQVYVVDRELLRRLYGALADVPLYVLDNMEFLPDSTPTPTAPGDPAVTE